MTVQEIDQYLEINFRLTLLDGQLSATIRKTLNTKRSQFTYRGRRISRKQAADLIQNLDYSNVIIL